MPACYLPLRAWRARDGTVTLGKQPDDTVQLALPCGSCLACKEAKAKGWALRCHLELQKHPTAVMATLTYDDAHLPATLSRRQLSRFLKRIRARLASKRRAKKRSTTARTIRFFASGEYGEITERPHYHAILYGAQESDRTAIQEAWSQGHAHIMTVTPAVIAYVAGYTAKKINDNINHHGEHVDPETGEVYTWQPPFLQMSRRPGIGGHSRIHTQSWRDYAILNGQKIPVPRYLHDAWEQQATLDELEMHEENKYKIQITKVQITSPKSFNEIMRDRQAQEQIAIAKQALKAAKRRKL